MPVTPDALRRLDDHWAVQAIGPAMRKSILDQANTRLVGKAVGLQMHLEQEIELAGDAAAMDGALRLAMAYEQAAIDNFEALLSDFADAEEGRDLAESAASRTFEVLRSLPIPDGPFDRIFHALHLSALAYCSDRWPELRGWLREHGPAIGAPTPIDRWDERLVSRIYESWLRLLRKNDWDDVDQIAELITGLREDQAQYEPIALASEGDARTAVALRLVALYHWARATELLATYMLQGEPRQVETDLDRHFDAAQRAAAASTDASLDVLLRWLHVAARRMAANAVWRVTDEIAGMPEFLRDGAHRRGLLELLPPQRMAIAEQGLLDPMRRAIVVDLPTSGGKTMLAELRILQALDTYRERGGWVAYVAPTRALVSQLTRRLRSDLGPAGVSVEQLSSAVDIDSFEGALLTDAGTADQRAFDVLVVTPEKLDMVIRGGTVDRPLALLVLDEAHNIEDEGRGLRIELLLATVRRDSPDARYLLLMPHVPNAKDLAAWLGGDTGGNVSLGTSVWQPNDRVIGMFWAEAEEGAGNWRMAFESLVTTRPTLSIPGVHRVGRVRPLNMARSKLVNGHGEQVGLGKQAAAMARIMSDRGTSIALARTIPDSWTMARAAAATLEPEASEEIALVQRFLATEISPSFELISLLRAGVGVHHAGLSDEARSLIEWLAEIGALRILCATTGIAQGINFPVSSVFLGSRQLPEAGSREMSKRSFWNLAGRAGRIDQDPIGIVGLARGTSESAVRQYVSDAAEELVSRLVTLLKDVDEAGELNNLAAVIHQEQWTDFRTYVAHLWNEHQNLEAVLAASESALRNTFGFSRLRQSTVETDRRRADALLTATRSYAAELAERPAFATLADATGFAPEGVRSAIFGMRGVDITRESWSPPMLFGGGSNSVLPQLIGVMMAIPQIRGSLADIASGGLSHRRIADLSSAWVGGASIEEIARTFFEGGQDLTKGIGDACKAIYRSLAYAGTWGLSALSKMPGSGIDFETLNDEDRRLINSLPAMLYHGVSTEAAVLMRMSSVPRTVAQELGGRFSADTGIDAATARPAQARAFLRDLTTDDWQNAAPAGAALSGEDYRKVWAHLSGEAAVAS